MQNNKVTVYLTGLSGRVGSIIKNGLAEKGYVVVPLNLRSNSCDQIERQLRMSKADGRNILIHAAGHNGRRGLLQSQTSYVSDLSKGNEELTRQLLDCLRASNLDIFILISSTKVTGETCPDSPYNKISVYGASKLRVENFILDQSDLAQRVVILRLAPIFSVRKRSVENFRRWISFGFPLPAASEFNQRTICTRYRLQKDVLEMLVSCGIKPSYEIKICGCRIKRSTADIFRVLARGLSSRPKFVTLPAFLKQLCRSFPSGSRLMNFLYESH